jgi:hypothetical protein
VQFVWPASVYSFGDKYLRELARSFTLDLITSKLQYGVCSLCFIKFTSLINPRSPGSAVGIATRYELDDPGTAFRVSVGPKIVDSPYHPDRLRGSPPIQWVPGALSPEVKRQGREADHSPPTSAEVKKTRIYTSTSPILFMAQCLVSQALGQLHRFFCFNKCKSRLFKIWGCHLLVTLLNIHPEAGSGMSFQRTTRRYIPEGRTLQY